MLFLRDLSDHLCKVKRGEAKSAVSVEAVAFDVGRLKHEEMLGATVMAIFRSSSFIV